jgi:hypothetical protein
LKFFYFFEIFLEVLGMGQGFWDNGGIAPPPPFFEACPLHLEVLNVPILMEIGDFTFSQILFFLNLEYTWTFISTIGIFVS